MPLLLVASANLAQSLAWQLIEMLRRFLLVGIFVVGPAPRGSIMQLALATILCLVYLGVQAFAQPYRSLADDVLAIVSSFALMLFFFACLLLKYDRVTDESELRARMSLQMRASLRLDAAVLTYVLLGCVRDRAQTFGARPGASCSHTCLICLLSLSPTCECRACHPSVTDRGDAHLLRTHLHGSHRRRGRARAASDASR